jgi:hypothetical protein
MGLRRLVKVKIGFKSGRLNIARIVQVTDSELILANGMSIKVLGEWRKHLSFWTNKETGEIYYDKQKFCGTEAYTILNHGQFTGIVVRVDPDRDIFADHVLGVNPPMGSSGGNYVDYCHEIMASDFGAWSELAMTL